MEEDHRRFEEDHLHLEEELHLHQEEEDLFQDQGLDQEADLLQRDLIHPLDHLQDLHLQKEKDRHQRVLQDRL